MHAFNAICRDAIAAQCTCTSTIHIYSDSNFVVNFCFRWMVCSAARAKRRENNAFRHISFVFFHHSIGIVTSVQQSVRLDVCAASLHFSTHSNSNESDADTVPTDSVCVLNLLQTCSVQRPKQIVSFSLQFSFFIHFFACASGPNVDRSISIYFRGVFAHTNCVEIILSVDCTWTTLRVKKLSHHVSDD